MLKTCLIFNAAAGAAGTISEWLQEHSNLHGVQYLAARQPGDLKQFAETAAATGFKRLIAAGGDGTISNIVNGAAAYLSDVELGILPLGTGNDLARSLGLPLDSVEEAFEIAVSGPATPMDLIRICGPDAHLCVNAATGGVGGKVAADVDSHDKARWGPFAYWMTAVTKLTELREYQVRLEVDDQIFESPLYGLVVANGRFVGGGFPIAPEASLDDGWLHVTTIPVLPTLELLAAGLSFTLGRHYQNRVKSYQARRVHVVSDPEMHFSMDGEPTKAIDTTFEVLPSAVRVVWGQRAH